MNAQGVQNVLQAVIAAAILWMAATAQDVVKTVELNNYRINKLEQEATVWRDLYHQNSR